MFISQFFSVFRCDFCHVSLSLCCLENVTAFQSRTLGQPDWLITTANKLHESFSVRPDEPQKPTTAGSCRDNCPALLVTPSSVGGDSGASDRLPVLRGSREEVTGRVMLVTFLRLTSVSKILCLVSLHPPPSPILLSFQAWLHNSRWRATTDQTKEKTKIRLFFQRGGEYLKQGERDV